LPVMFLPFPLIRSRFEILVLYPYQVACTTPFFLFSLSQFCVLGVTPTRFPELQVVTVRLFFYLFPGKVPFFLPVPDILPYPPFFPPPLSFAPHLGRPSHLFFHLHHPRSHCVLFRANAKAAEFDYPTPLIAGFHLVILPAFLISRDSPHSGPLLSALNPAIFSAVSRLNFFVPFPRHREEGHQGVHLFPPLSGTLVNQFRLPLYLPFRRAHIPFRNNVLLRFLCSCRSRSFHLVAPRHATFSFPVSP